MKVDFSEENKVTSGEDFPRLRLEQNERARIALVEKDVEMEFVHTLRVPQIDEQGRVVKTEKSSNRPGGKKYFVTEKDFVGSHRCFGRQEYLLKPVSQGGNGMDPEQCPTCQASVDSEGAIEPPERSYAMHVLQYTLEGGGMSGSFNVAKPLTLKCVVWRFSKGRYNDLIDLKATWGDLRTHDLCLGPCEHKGYQKFDLNMIPPGAWCSGADEEEVKKNIAYASEVYKNNRCPDLVALIARKVTRDQALEDIALVLDTYARVNGTGAASVQVPGDITGLDTTVAGILDGFDEPAKLAPATVSIDLDDMFAKDAVSQTPVVVEDDPLAGFVPPPAEAPDHPSPAAAVKEEDPLDLSSIADTPQMASVGAAIDLDKFLGALED